MDTVRAIAHDPAAAAADDGVQWFRDGAGRVWHAYVVIERTKYGVALDKTRHNWLCLESEGERRFISPVPSAWREWSEAEFRHELVHSRVDLRG